MFLFTIWWRLLNTAETLKNYIKKSETTAICNTQNETWLQLKDVLMFFIVIIIFQALFYCVTNLLCVGVELPLGKQCK